MNTETKSGMEELPLQPAGMGAPVLETSQLSLRQKRKPLWWGILFIGVAVYGTVDAWQNVKAEEVALEEAKQCKESAAQSDGLSAEDRAELQEIVDTLLTAGRHYSATGKLYVKRIATLAPLVLDGASMDVALPETKGNTMLHYACALCCFELFDWLIEHNADVNKLTDKGKSPLDCVGAGEDADLLRYHIIKHGGRKGR